MKVKVKKVMDFMEESAGVTIWKDNIKIKDRKKFFLSEHSPIRTVVFKIDLTGIPAFVSTHFVRHSATGQLHFVSSCREDRGFKGIADRNTPVNHTMFLNAQHIIDISRKRLCRKSHVETRKIWSAILLNIFATEPALSFCCKSECEYRGFCPEFKSCGYFKGCKND